MKTITRLAAALGLCALAGCGAVPIAAGIGGAGALSTAISIAQAAPVVLSDAAQAACAIQAGINANTAHASDPGLARGLAIASAVAGSKCTW